MVKIEMKRIKGIDFVKFICSLLVVMIHVSPFGEATSSTKFYLMNDFLQNYICRLAVPFFFICNGYFLEKKLSVSGNDCTIIKNIVFKTLKLYIKWSIIYLPINLVIILHDKSGLLHGIIGYVKNFVFIGSYTQLWYLNSLIIALLLIYVFTKMKVPSSIIMKLSFVLYIIGLFDDSYYGILNFTPIIKTCVDKYNLLFGTTRNGLFFGLFFISLGMYLAKINLSIDYKKCVLLFTCSSMALFVE